MGRVQTLKKVKHHNTPDCAGHPDCSTSQHILPHYGWQGVRVRLPREQSRPRNPGKQWHIPERQSPFP